MKQTIRLFKEANMAGLAVGPSRKEKNAQT